VAAACILPLTQVEIGKEFGTRHRAAVGVSEEADAIALIVSEETGRVSIAMGGTLRKDLSEKQVREILLQGEANESKNNGEPKKKRSLRLIRRLKKDDKNL